MSKNYNKLDFPSNSFSSSFVAALPGKKENNGCSGFPVGTGKGVFF